MGVDRRVSDRMRFTGGYLPPAARIRPGRAIVIVDLSCGGALVEGPWRFRPLSRCDLHVQLSGEDVHRRARIVRCFVARIARQEAVRYRTALAFDQVLELPQCWDALDGYRIPVDLPEAAFRGVVDTPAAVQSPVGARSETPNAPFLRNA